MNINIIFLVYIHEREFEPNPADFREFYNFNIIY